MKAINIKKSIVLILMAIGFIIIVADSNAGFLMTLMAKMAGIITFFLGVQLCATWHLFQDYLNED